MQYPTRRMSLFMWQNVLPSIGLFVVHNRVVMVTFYKTLNVYNIRERRQDVSMVDIYRYREKCWKIIFPFIDNFSSSRFQQVERNESTGR